jgi:SAM-dependent methyltransferase
MSTSSLAFDALVVHNVLGSSFLDVGCGLGKWGFLLKKYRWADNPESKPPTVTGIDLFEPHIKSLRAQNIYDSLAVGSATSLPFKDKSFDSTIACEVIEHLTEPEGLMLISELRRVSRLSFVVSTPNFHCLRGAGRTPDGLNPFEAHRHNLLYKECRSLGFTQIAGVGLLAPSHKIRQTFASLGFYFPRFSWSMLGFWFADGKKRVLETV